MMGLASAICRLNPQAKTGFNDSWQNGTADVNSYGPQEPCLPPEMTSCWLLPSAFMIQIPPDAVHEIWEPSGDQDGS